MIFLCCMTAAFIAGSLHDSVLVKEGLSGIIHAAYSEGIRDGQEEMLVEILDGEIVVAQK